MVWLGEVEVTNQIQLAPSAALREGAVEVVDDLCVMVHPFFFDISGNRGRYPGVLDQVVTDDSTNFVFLDLAGALQVSTVSYPATVHIRLARVIAAGGFICKVFLERAFLGTTAAANLVQAATNPGAADDSYAIGVIWINTVTGQTWIIKDNTATAAVWVQIGGPAWLENLFTPTPAQVTFIISQAPTDLGSVTFEVNGVITDPASDFTVSGTTVTWLNTSFVLGTTDRVSIRYR